MRNVILTEYIEQPDGTCKFEERGLAIFHAFGINYRSLGKGIGHYTTAIVEFPDGSIKNIDLECIKFVCNNEWLFIRMKLELKL